MLQRLAAAVVLVCIAAQIAGH